MTTEVEQLKRELGESKKEIEELKKYIHDLDKDYDRLLALISRHEIDI